MARDLGERFRITAALETAAPLSVGGRAYDPDVDLPLARDGRGKLYVPGTSLAGPLRAWVRRHYDDGMADDLFGFQKQGSDRGAASRLLIEDAVLTDVSEDCVELRDGVGIDRFSGAAASGFKYERAVLPKGTRIPLKILVEFPEAEGKATELKSVVRELLDALAAGHLGFGAARTRGLGGVTLVSEPEVVVEDWATTNGVLAFLRGTSPRLDRRQLPASSNPMAALPRLDVEVEWEPSSPVMVKSGVDGLVVDMLPLVSGKGNQALALVIPGSSVKGALRGQAERIIRTVLGMDAPTVGSKLSDQLSVPLVEHLFGSDKRPAEETQSSSSEPSPPAPGRGILAAADCYGASEFSRSQWLAVQHAVAEEELRQALDQAGLRETQHVFHNAVDRWLGGAADRFLFSGLEPLHCQWEPIRLSLDLDRLPAGNMRTAAVALLLLLISDMEAGRIPIGIGANRGMGWVRLKSVALAGTALDGDLAGLDGPRSATGAFSQWLEEQKALIQPVERGWQSWLDSYPDKKTEVK